MRPNDYQVGGEHYGGSNFQHWDWVVENNLGYVEGQITKYLSRWRRKGLKQDLEKAAHYADKLVECASQRLAVKLRRLFGSQTFPDFTCKHLAVMQETYGLTPEETEVFQLVCEYRTNNAVERIQTLVHGMLKQN